MKFSKSIIINRPHKEVVDLWTNPENNSNWQDGYEKQEIIEGDRGAVGTKTRLFFKHGKREMELIETVLENDLPHSFKGLYEHKSMVNTMKSTFEAIDDKTTRYTADVHYTKFIGIMPKLMSMLMPGMFRKQGEKWYNQFKAFAEEVIPESQD